MRRPTSRMDYRDEESSRVTTESRRSQTDNDDNDDAPTVHRITWNYQRPR